MMAKSIMWASVLRDEIAKLDSKPFLSAREQGRRSSMKEALALTIIALYPSLKQGRAMFPDLGVLFDWIDNEVPGIFSFLGWQEYGCECKACSPDDSRKQMSIK